MNEAIDRRMWSTTVRGLVDFVGDLLNLGIPSTSVRNLQLIFKEHGIYPARDFAQRCTPAPPDAFFTYHSAENFVDIQEIVWQTCGFAAGLLRERRPELWDVDLDPLIADGIRLWVDFMFIDQSARDIRQELDALPLLLEGARAHFVLGQLPLTRAWCCYEIALFNQHSAAPDEPPLKSFIAPSRNIYFGWENVETTEADDKLFIEDRISKGFPDGFTGFNHVMNQANATAILPLTEGHPFYSPSSLEALGEAVEFWYDRAA